jgi:hypothetical protein
MLTRVGEAVVLRLEAVLELPVLPSVEERKRAVDIARRVEREISAYLGTLSLIPPLTAGDRGWTMVEEQSTSARG